ncbi:hypothetical protein DXG01_004732 [Tephrocybe rancida]|nr:hypothetical protein DXG01_004732 [Tephrocybe rancida]
MLPIGYVGLFKESSCLEELSLHSPNHNLLNLDIPWGQLVRLDVSVDLPSEMNTAEASQFLTHPGCLGKLRILHLGGSQNLSSVVLTLAFPWSQLLSLNITKIPSTLYDLLFQTLQKAVALNDLALSFNSIDGEVPSYPSPVASTQSLSLIYFPPTIFTNFPAIGSDLGALRLIDQPVHPPAFYQILRQCPHIVSLECSISSHGVVHTGNISMIRLRQLKIYILSNTWIFNPLSMPALTSLEVYTWEQLDFVPLHQLIVRSACSIQMLTLGTSDIDLLSNSYSGPSEYEPTQWIDEPLGLDDLLGSIPGVTSAHLSCVIFPDQLIHQFAHRAVLPNVETLYLATSSFDAFFSMVKLRLREEQAQGGVNLRVIRAIARGQPERTSSQLQVLNKKYGIECSFDYTV